MVRPRALTLVTYCRGQYGSGAVCHCASHMLSALAVPTLAAPRTPGAKTTPRAKSQLGNGAPLHRSWNNCSTSLTQAGMACQGPARHSRTLQPSTARAGVATAVKIARHTAIKAFDFLIDRSPNTLSTLT